MQKDTFVNQNKEHHTFLRFPCLMRQAHKHEVSSCGRRGLGLPRKPIFLCDNLLSSSSLRKSPPVPVRVCSRSPVQIWRQNRERRAASMVNPDCPPCCAFFFCSLLLECDLLAKKVPGRAPFSQHNIFRNWT